MKNYFISTKMVTTNIGNQALSDELIHLADKLQNQNHRFKIFGRPTGLDRYTIDDLDKNRLIEEFEETVQKIYKASKGFRSEAFESNTETKRTNLLEAFGAVMKTEKLRDIARFIRKKIYDMMTITPKYKGRIVNFQKDFYYLYSGAGEIAAQHYFYRQLIDLRLAQLKGMKVGAINQSVELFEGPYKTLLGHVYSKMHKLVVRGQHTKDALIGLGLNPEIISLSPDTAFLTSVPFRKKRKEIKKIAINFTNPTYEKDQVNKFVKKLVDNGYHLEFISNAPFADSNIAEDLENNFNVKNSSKTEDYKEYVKFMQKFDLVISARLHTNELALTGGVPIIPIEGNRYKTTEVFELIKYPIKTVRSSESSYADNLWERLEELNNNFHETQNWIEDNLPQIREAAQLNITNFQ